MKQIPILPKGHKVQIAWSSRGRRLMGTCWWNQVSSFLDRRVLPGSTNIVLRCRNRSYELGDKL